MPEYTLITHNRTTTYLQVDEPKSAIIGAVERIPSGLFRWRLFDKPTNLANTLKRTRPVPDGTLRPLASRSAAIWAAKHAYENRLAAASAQPEKDQETP